MGYSMQPFSFLCSSRRPRLLALAVALPVVLLGDAALPRLAQAYDPDPVTGTGTTPTGLTKDDFEDLRLWSLDGDEWVPFNNTIYETFFNRANCLCNAPLRIQLLLKASARAKVTRGARADIVLRAGDQTCVCTGANCANLNCKDLGPVKDLNGLINGGLTFDTTVREVFEAGRPATATGNVCDRDEMQNLWVWMDSDDAGRDTELTDFSKAIELDGVPPPAPSGLRVTPGNDALELAWDPLDYLDDFQGYIVFCSRGENLPVFPGAFSPLYYTPAGVCPGQTTAGATTGGGAVAQEQPTGGSSGPAPVGLATLDPQFVCSKIITAESRLRLFQLQNGIPYAVAVASVDKRGNASVIDSAVLQVPIPTRDFYRSYREGGGSAEGGFCAIATTRGAREPWLALVVILPLAALAIRRARRRP